MSMATRIPVGGDAPYEVVVGAGVLSELAGLVGKRAVTVAVIHAEGLAELASPVIRALTEAGFTVHATGIPDGEAAKSIDVAAGLWSWLASSPGKRSDCAGRIGGGGGG